MPKLKNGMFELKEDCFLTTENAPAVIDLFVAIEADDLAKVRQLIELEKVLLSNQCYGFYRDRYTRRDGTPAFADMRFEVEIVSEALQFAVRHASEPLFTFLAKRVVEPIQRNNALRLSAIRGKIDCVKVLLELGANINAKSGYDQSGGETALSEALDNQHLQLVKFLLTHPNLDLNAKRYRNVEIYSELFNKSDCSTMIQACIDPNDGQASVNNFVSMGRNNLTVLVKNAGTLHEYREILMKAVHAIRKSEKRVTQLALEEDSLYRCVKRKTKPPFKVDYDALGVALLVVLPAGLVVFGMQAILRCCKSQPPCRRTIGETLFGTQARKDEKSESFVSMTNIK